MSPTSRNRVSESNGVKVDVDGWNWTKSRRRNRSLVAVALANAEQQIVVGRRQVAYDLAGRNILDDEPFVDDIGLYANAGAGLRHSLRPNEIRHRGDIFEVSIKAGVTARAALSAGLFVVAEIAGSAATHASDAPRS